MTSVFLKKTKTLKHQAAKRQKKHQYADFYKKCGEKNSNRTGDTCILLQRH